MIVCFMQMNKANNAGYSNHSSSIFEVMRKYIEVVHFV